MKNNLRVMNMKNQSGFVQVLAALIITVVFLMALASPFVRIAFSEQIVSGIVYNNTNNSFIYGNTGFSIRAAENTMVTAENESRYCLPHGSQYIELVNEAAKDKNIKLIVTTEKMFKFVPPFGCADNVKVERQ